MEIFVGILSQMVFLIVFELSVVIFKSVRDVYFPSRRGTSGRWALFGWSIGHLAGIAAGAVSLSLAPERVARGAIATGLVWFTLPLVCGVLALSAGR